MAGELEWYWIDDGRRVGPISGEAFAQALGEGRIGPDTPVKEESWVQWLPYREAAEKVGEHFELERCLYSGQLLPKQGLLQYGDGYVAPSHKDAFVRAMESGQTVPAGEAAAGDEMEVERGFAGFFRALFTLVASRFWFLLAAYLAAAVPGAVTLFVMGNFIVAAEDAWALVWLGVGLYLTTDVLAISVSLVVLARIWQGRSITFVDAFIAGFGLWGKMVVTVLIVGLTLMVSTMLLVIPGLVFGARLVVANCAVAFEGKWGTRAFSQSWYLTRGYFWPALGCFLLIMLIPFGIERGREVLLAIPSVGSVPATNLVYTFVTLPLELIGIAMSVVFYQKCWRRGPR